ncbi:molybdopterin-dependent oxidoreductase [Hyphomicrobium sp. D-2]|uniref:molybdopterin-dependent oxidoreductase n=1 Tax=Hyphomicrobium sp. D-2 TaxID=3041621 RepID=UPI002455EAE5|nr:molybdopterin-dependent oxidoreductase [Hyphomicrobium sp. D-2]MDH4981528.1 molybdopterin-dependent oxidoreductase [Hyphomicrobium sp. D-2]
MIERKRTLSRRSFIIRGAAAGGAALLGGCDQLSQSPSFRDMLNRAEGLTEWAQRLVLSQRSLAREYAESDISAYFKPNGSTRVADPEYIRASQNGFADWKLRISGLVERPGEFSLDELRCLPSRTQITRHDCVEGWSAIGKWKGAQLGPILQSVGLKPDARFIVFHCADKLSFFSNYYESIDLIDAFHPQTILAYEMNGAALPVPHGAPLRLRVERQLGYKHAKYIQHIEVVSSYSDIGDGLGSYWADRGYEWYAGI